MLLNQNTNRNCTDIIIVDDTVVENTETFQVSLNTSDPILFPSEPISVAILDNVDRKFNDKWLPFYSSFHSVHILMLYVNT